MNTHLNKPESVSALEAAKAAAGSDMMQYMLVVFPAACNVLAPVLEKWGFTADQGGAMMFLQAIKEHENDEEIKASAREMKNKFIPEDLGPMLAGAMGL